MFKVNVFILSLICSMESLAEFTIYDATLYKNKPDLTTYNIKYLPIIYENTFFGDNKSKDILPETDNISKVANIIETSGSNIVVLDIERWKLKGSNYLVYNSVVKYRKVIDNTRKQGSRALIGYYGLPPIRDYWRAITNENSLEYLAWKKENDNIQQLASDVDIFFPSLYTFYSNQKGWKKYAIAQISEARRLGNEKPIIVFLWPQYHESNKILGGKYLSAEFWRLQLDTAKKYADGVIIWGGWKQNWDANAPWWFETLKFMKDNNLN
jgi:hypothetical protein